MDDAPWLSLTDLTVLAPQAGVLRPIVQDVSFSLARGERLGIVGASGSGKTTLAMALLGLLPRALTVRGQIAADGQAAPLQPQTPRPSLLAAMFQDPSSSLNPYLRIGTQLDEVKGPGRPSSARQRRGRSIAMLKAVGLSDATRRCDEFAHTLSGGMRQRVALAMAMLASPRCLVADEPTTALDATVQAEVLTCLLGQCERDDTALVFVTHDLRVLARVATRVLVMQDGCVVEDCSTKAFFAGPAHPHSQRLLAGARAIADGGAGLESARPTSFGPARASLAPPSAPLLEARGIGFGVAAHGRWPWSRAVRGEILRDINCRLSAGEIVALIGESGSGKSTLGRVLSGLLPPSAGQLTVPKSPGPAAAVQMIWQHPQGSLDGRQSVGAALSEAVHCARPGLGTSAQQDAVHANFAAVRLPAELLAAPCAQLSGGQAQRVALARALLTEPRVLIADEATSALDSDSRNQILDLLLQLAKARGLAILFITHDLAAAGRIADRALTMYMGRLVETATASRLLRAPLHPYSQALVRAQLPLAVQAKRAEADSNSSAPGGHVPSGEAASLFAPAPGCAFAARCPHAIPRCRDETPKLVAVSQGRLAACHLVPTAPSCAALGQS